MNKDETVSLIVKVLLMVLTPLAAKQHIDGNTLTGIVTDLADAGVLVYGVYSHWNMKKVPENSTVLPPVSK